MNFIRELVRVGVLTIRSGIQSIYGVYRLSRIAEPMVTIFGGSHAYEKGKYSRWAQEAASLCVEHKMAVVTGGGPGIMEAANCGAYEVEKNKKWTLGVRVKGVNPEFENKCTSSITVDYFFARKWLLTRYSSGFILFPGGIGTADEFFEVLNSINLKRMPKVPIVLVGTNYWHHLVGWYRHAYDRELIPLAPEEIFVVTDDPQEAVAIIARFCSPLLSK